MGLDILCYGGRFMRLSFQRCLIPWLCFSFVSFDVFSAPSAPHISAEMSCDFRGTRTSSQCSEPYSNNGSFTGYNNGYTYYYGQGYTCPRPDYPEFYAEYETRTWNGNSYSFMDGFCIQDVKPEDCFEEGKTFNPTTGSCSLDCPNGALNGQCLQNPDSDCSSQSPDYMGAIGSSGSAVCESQFNECQGSGGQFGIINGNSVCLADNYGPPTLCGAGEISVYDTHGFTCSPIIGGGQNPQWEGGQPNQDTDGDGVPDIFNPNLANTSEMLQIVGGNLFNQNNSIINQNDITNQNLTNINNTINNQTNTTNNNLTNINESINQGNQQSQQGVEGLAGQLGQISGDLGALRGMGERGELSGGGVGGDGGDAGTGAGLQSPTGEDYLADLSVIETNTKNTADRLQTFEDGLKAPEGGFNPNGFGGFIPTFEESGTAFISAIEGMSQVQALTKFANIQENTVCPVFTLPSTPVSGELVMDIHCRVFEDYRAMISAIFLFFWSGLSLFVFFKA